MNQNPPQPPPAQPLQGAPLLEALPPKQAPLAPAGGAPANTPPLPKHAPPQAVFLWFFLAVLLFSLYLLFTIFQPFLHSIILSCVFTGLTYPLYLRLLNITKKPMVASLIVLLCLTFLVALPITLMIIGLIPQAASSFSAINNWLADKHLATLLDAYVQPLLLWVHNLFPELDVQSLDIQDSVVSASRQTGQFMLNAGTYILSNIARFLIHFILILLMMFFLLMDGAGLLSKLQYYAPLKPQQTEGIMDGMRRMAKAVLAGGLAIAVLQGLAGGIAFAIVGLPAMFWGFVMVITAFIPVFGTSLIWIPAAIGLYATGQTGSAIFITVWGVAVIGSIDNFLRPVLMRGGANVPLLFTFLSILGGINVFGIVGLLYGPMILGLAATMLEIYGEEYHSILQTREHTPRGKKQQAPPPVK
ncbi:AI-2E family transporter [Desulfovibrio cuneatus]|uniref:AI-2E family transporter n=1 Tax=Desulfovibrio cuneatus TaxID=159728 RepID=UPI00041721D5|nr:AI-2E family transporter [Desulfovibrio cuneatus]